MHAYTVTHTHTNTLKFMHTYICACIHIHTDIEAETEAKEAKEAKARQDQHPAQWRGTERMGGKGKMGKVGKVGKVEGVVTKREIDRNRERAQAFVAAAEATKPWSTEQPLSIFPGANGETRTHDSPITVLSRKNSLDGSRGSQTAAAERETCAVVSGWWKGAAKMPHTAMMRHETSPFVFRQDKNGLMNINEELVLVLKHPADIHWRDLPHIQLDLRMLDPSQLDTMDTDSSDEGPRVHRGESICIGSIDLAKAMSSRRTAEKRYEEKEEKEKMYMYRLDGRMDLAPAVSSRRTHEQWNEEERRRKQKFICFGSTDMATANNVSSLFPAMVSRKT